MAYLQDQQPERQVMRVTTVEEFDEDGNLVTETVEREFFTPRNNKFPGPDVYEPPF